MAEEKKQDFLEESCIYLDYNATSPTDPEVASTMAPFLHGHFGNASSGHFYGVKSRQAVENARKQVAELINCDPSEVILTSGGTESNNIALQGAIRHLQRTGKGNHVITSTIEHWCTIGTLEDMQANEGVELTKISVNSDGVVNLEELKAAIKPGKTILISIMHANNQVGTIQPINEIGALCTENDILFHTDAIQTAGKVAIDVNEMQADLLTIASHKFYGPKGAGALYIRNKERNNKQPIHLSCIIHGAHQERGLRGGTENVLSIVGFGKACALAKQHLDERVVHSKHLRDLLLDTLREEFADTPEQVVIIGDINRSLPNTLAVSFPGVKSYDLIQSLKLEVAFSAGAACSSGLNISPTLLAMGIPANIALGMIRLSTGQFLSENDAKLAAKKVANTVKALLQQQ